MTYDKDVYKECLEFAKAAVAGGRITLSGVEGFVDDAYPVLLAVRDKYDPKPDYSDYDRDDAVFEPTDEPTDDNCPF